MAGDGAPALRGGGVGRGGHRTRRGLFFPQKDPPPSGAAPPRPSRRWPKQNLRGRATIALRVVAETKAGRREKRGERGTAVADLDPGTAELFERLRALRLELARQEGIAAYMVFGDRSLLDMARLRPRNRDDLKLVHGVGDAKLARYGTVFLKAVAEFPRP